MPVRDAVAADLSEICTLVRDLAAYERLEHEVVFDEATVGRHLFGPEPAARVLLAVEGDGAVVGFALWFPTFSTFLGVPGIWLEDLFVEPGHRGAGIGKGLLRRLASLAVERGCGRFEWRVLDWNEPSIRFYEALGATIMKEWLLVRMTEPEFARLAAGEGRA